MTRQQWETVCEQAIELSRKYPVSLVGVYGVKVKDGDGTMISAWTRFGGQLGNTVWDGDYQGVLCRVYRNGERVPGMEPVINGRIMLAPA